MASHTEIGISAHNLPILESSQAFPPRGDIFRPRETPEQETEKPAYKIAAWLNKIEDARSKDEDYQGYVKDMKNELHEVYIIKPENFPQSHWDLKGENAISNGREKELLTDGVLIVEKTIHYPGDTSTTKREFTFPQELKEQEINLVISNQKKSLDAWIDHLTSDGAIHPMWAKVWVLESLIMIEESEIHKKRDKFKDRVKEATALFPTLNVLFLENTINQMHNILKKQSKTQQPDRNDQKLLSKDRFSKLYAKQWYQDFRSNSRKIAEANLLSKDEGKQSHEGESTTYQTYKYETFKNSTEKLKEIKLVLKKYPQGSNPQDLVDDLKGHKYKWCIAKLETAEEYLEIGDIYIFYSRNPRLIVTMKGSGETAEITEVKGIGPKENVDAKIALFIGDMLEKNYGEKAKDYQKKAADMKHLTELEEKQKNNKGFSKEDIHFLYEMDENIEGFGYDKDPRIQEIIKKRNIKEDLASVLGTTKDRISLTEEEALSGGILYHHGPLRLNGLTSAERVTFPEEVGGNVLLNSLTRAERVTFPKEVGGNVLLNSLTSAERVTFPKKVGGTLCLSNHFNEDHPEIIELKNRYPNLKLKFAKLIK